jgi:hypothetical protein
MQRDAQIQRVCIHECFLRKGASGRGRETETVVAWQSEEMAAPPVVLPGGLLGSQRVNGIDRGGAPRG